MGGHGGYFEYFHKQRLSYVDIVYSISIEDVAASCAYSAADYKKVGTSCAGEIPMPHEVRQKGYEPAACQYAACDKNIFGDGCKHRDF